MKKTDAKKLVDTLNKAYPDATCSLDFETPFQLVVAVMLSAQCTDERVNKTTPALFSRCKTIEDFVNIDIKELKKIIGDFNYTITWKNIWNNRSYEKFYIKDYIR